MTNPDSMPRTGAGGPQSRSSANTQSDETPNTGMQAEDAGTGDSAGQAGGTTAVESAMKQTSKTDAESGPVSLSGQR